MRNRTLRTVLIVALFALALTGFALADEPLPTAEPTHNDTHQHITLETYTQGLFPGAALSDATIEAIETLYSFQGEIDELTADADLALGPADLNRIRGLLTAEEDLEEKLDRFEDHLEASYRAKAFDQETYRALDRELERLDDLLDDCEDLLEEYFDDD